MTRKNAEVQSQYISIDPKCNDLMKGQTTYAATATARCARYSVSNDRRNWRV